MEALQLSDSWKLAELNFVFSTFVCVLRKRETLIVCLGVVCGIEEPFLPSLLTRCQSVFTKQNTN